MQQTRNTRTGTNARAVPDLGWVDSLTNLMDSRFRLPGTNFRFGLDPILGLLPGIGDATSLAISGALIFYMYRHGASRKAMIMMIGNVFLDATIGSIPILGNIFDFAYKANERNIRIMKRHYHEGKYQGKGTGMLVAAALVLLAVIVLILWGTWELVSWLFEGLQAGL
ncbi:DUF4112 domain-containing protein [Catalinimonas niigatensis]|uniref:DUF4112 domain-containing protein n=1 Tax=Catalinimonas niigatensis TaxID=1397264 RepID=UPI00266553EF|nr:DUF4112 domain-containing protein [Catalinimonas niigatensis]WPP53112.1 DUF4112 domain-containing protein [Catalinimonas niigatensis]